MSACKFNLPTGETFNEKEFKAYLLNGGLKAFQESEDVNIDIAKEETKKTAFETEVEETASKIKKDELNYSEAIKDKSDEFIKALDNELTKKARKKLDEKIFKESVKRKKDFGLTKEEIIADLEASNSLNKKKQELIEDVFLEDEQRDKQVKELKEEFDKIINGKKPKSVLYRLADSSVTDLVAEMKNDAHYEAISNTQLEALADYWLSVTDLDNIEHTLDELERTPNMRNVMPILMAKSIVKLQEQGDNKKASKIIQRLADVGISSGQTIQSYGKAYDILKAKGNSFIKTQMAIKALEAAQRIEAKKFDKIKSDLGIKEEEIDRLNKKIHEQTLVKPSLKDKMIELVDKICNLRRKNKEHGN